MLTVQLGAAKNSSQGKLCQLTEGYPWLIPCPIQKNACHLNQASLILFGWKNNTNLKPQPVMDMFGIPRLAQSSLACWKHPPWLLTSNSQWIGLRNKFQQTPFLTIRYPGFLCPTEVRQNLQHWHLHQWKSRPTRNRKIWPLPTTIVIHLTPFSCGVLFGRFSWVIQDDLYGKLTKRFQKIQGSYPKISMRRSLSDPTAH